MKTLRYRLLFALCIGIAWLSCALARYGGPGYLMNAAATGAPGEITCTACHAGGSGGGSLQLEIINGPTGYQPGATYTLRASLQAPGAEVGGMQVVALDGNTTLGQWIAPSGMRAVTVSSFGNAPRDYLEHSAPQQANNQGQVDWIFDWKAPLTQGHSPVFYAASVAANDDYTPNGDQVFQTYFSMGSLPVEWGSFELKAQHGSVSLFWETLKEDNSQSFEVQRSIDGHGFETLGSLPAEGKAALYEWTDYHPYMQKEIFYRIKQSDQNGQYAFSEVKRILLDDLPEGLSAMYPNMVQDGQQATFEFFANENSELTINLQQLDGKRLFSQTIRLEPGMNRGNIETVGLKRGQYVVLFNKGKYTTAKRLFVME